MTRDPNTNFVTSKLLDFGVALDLEAPPRKESVAGDPRYMAPEQTWAKQKIDHRVDIYSAGMSLYEILAGRHPFGDLEGRSVRTWIEAQRERPVPSIEQHLAPGTSQEVALGLDAIIRKACHKDPLHRHASARDMQKELLSLVERQSVAVPAILDDRAGRV